MAIDREILAERISTLERHYEELDMVKIYKIAQEGPDDLRRFFSALVKIF